MSFKNNFKTNLFISLKLFRKWIGFLKLFPNDYFTNLIRIITIFLSFLGHRPITQDLSATEPQAETSIVHRSARKWIIRVEFENLDSEKYGDDANTNITDQEKDDQENDDNSKLSSKTSKPSDANYQKTKEDDEDSQDENSFHRGMPWRRSVLNGVNSWVLY